MNNEELWEAVHLEDYARVKHLLEERELQVGDKNFIFNLISDGKTELFGWAYRHEDGYYVRKFPLVEAARTGNLQIAKILIKHHASPNPKRSESALHAAFFVSKETSPGVYERDLSKSHEMIKYLVEQGADVNASVGHFPSPLQQAVALDDREMLDYFLKNGADVNKRSHDHSTALGKAIQAQNLVVVKLLIAYGADPSFGTCDDKPLIELAKELGNQEIIDALLLREMELLKIRELLQAIELKNSTSVEKLLEQGLDPNRGLYVDGRHYAEWIYPLIRAAGTQNLSIAKLLIHYGANVNVAEPSDGRTPLHSAKSHELIRYFVEQGANVNAEGGFCLTPLLLAIGREDLEMVEYLIQNGADVNKCLRNVDENESRTTSVGAAVQMSNLSILELLIKYGAKVNQDPFCAITPLEEAQELGNEKIIELLNSTQ